MHIRSLGPASCAIATRGRTESFAMSAQTRPAPVSRCIVASISSRIGLLLLKPKTLKPQRPAILRHRPHRPLRHSTRYISLDFKRHLHVGPIKRRQMLDHLLHDLPSIPGHHPRIDFDRTVETMKLRLLNCWATWCTWC